MKRFTRPKGSSRLYCEVCAPPKLRAKRPAAGGTVTGLPGVGQGAPEVERAPGPLEMAARAELASVGREGSMAGAVAVHLAQLMDGGGHTGSQTASLSRELRASLADAVAGAMPVGDWLDELQQARQARIDRSA